MGMLGISRGQSKNHLRKLQRMMPVTHKRSDIVPIFNSQTGEPPNSVRAVVSTGTHPGKDLFPNSRGGWLYSLSVSCWNKDFCFLLAISQRPPSFSCHVDCPNTAACILATLLERKDDTIFCSISTYIWSPSVV